MGPLLGFSRLEGLTQQKVLTMAWTWVGYLSMVLDFKYNLYHEA